MIRPLVRRVRMLALAGTASVGLSACVHDPAFLDALLLATEVVAAEAAYNYSHDYVPVYVPPPSYGHPPRHHAGRRHEGHGARGHDGRRGHEGRGRRGHEGRGGHEGHRGGKHERGG